MCVCECVCVWWEGEEGRGVKRRSERVTRDMRRNKMSRDCVCVGSEKDEMESEKDDKEVDETSASQCSYYHP